MSDEDDFRLRAKARKSSSRGVEVHIPANYKGFFQEARIALVRGKAVSGRRTLTKPVTPRTGRGFVTLMPVFRQSAKFSQ